jgi:ubiquinone/menaquinone biosynthesis C-methylase UbiE
LTHPSRIYVVGANPFEVAAAQYVSRLAGFTIDAKIGDNLLATDGRLWFPDAKVDWFQWNTPSIAPRTPPPTPRAIPHYPRFGQLHDGNYSDAVYRRLIEGLKVMAPDRALLWTGGDVSHVRGLLEEAQFGQHFVSWSHNVAVTMLTPPPAMTADIDQIQDRAMTAAAASGHRMMIGVIYKAVKAALGFLMPVKVQTATLVGVPGQYAVPLVDEGKIEELTRRIVPAVEQAIFQTVGFGYLWAKLATGLGLWHLPAIAALALGAIVAGLMASSIFAALHIRQDVKEGLDSKEGFKIRSLTSGYMIWLIITGRWRKAYRTHLINNLVIDEGMNGIDERLWRAYDALPGWMKDMIAIRRWEVDETHAVPSPMTVVPLNLGEPLSSADRKRIIQIGSRIRIIVGGDDSPSVQYERHFWDSTFAKWRKAPGRNWVWVLRDSANVIQGYAWVKRSSNIEGEVELYHLSIAEGQDGRGYGTQLAETATRSMISQPDVLRILAQDTAEGAVGHILTKGLSGDIRYEPLPDNSHWYLLDIGSRHLRQPEEKGPPPAAAEPRLAADEAIDASASLTLRDKPEAGEPLLRMILAPGHQLIQTLRAAVTASAIPEDQGGRRQEGIARLLARTASWSSMARWGYYPDTDLLCLSPVLGPHALETLAATTQVIFADYYGAVIDALAMRRHLRQAIFDLIIPAMAAENHHPPPPKDLSAKYASQFDIDWNALLEDIGGLTPLSNRESAFVRYERWWNSHESQLKGKEPIIFSRHWPDFARWARSRGLPIVLITDDPHAEYRLARDEVRAQFDAIQVLPNLIQDAEAFLASELRRREIPQQAWPAQLIFTNYFVLVEAAKKAALTAVAMMDPQRISEYEFIRLARSADFAMSDFGGSLLKICRKGHPGASPAVPTAAPTDTSRSTPGGTGVSESGRRDEHHHSGRIDDELFASEMGFSKRAIRRNSGFDSQQPPTAPDAADASAPAAAVLNPEEAGDKPDSTDTDRESLERLSFRLAAALSMATGSEQSSLDWVRLFIHLVEAGVWAPASLESDMNNFVALLSGSTPLANWGIANRIRMARLGTLTGLTDRMRQAGLILDQFSFDPLRHLTNALQINSLHSRGYPVLPGTNWFSLTHNDVLAVQESAPAGFPREGAKVLHLCGGNAAFFEQVRHLFQNSQLVLADANPENIRQAIIAFQRFNDGNRYEARLADVRSGFEGIPYPEGTFDVIFFVGDSEFRMSQDDLARILAEAFRVLKPNTGRLILETTKFDHIIPSLNLLRYAGENHASIHRFTKNLYVLGRSLSPIPFAPPENQEGMSDSVAIAIEHAIGALGHFFTEMALSELRKTLIEVSEGKMGVVTAVLTLGFYPSGFSSSSEYVRLATEVFTGLSNTSRKGLQRPVSPPEPQSPTVGRRAA